MFRRQFSSGTTPAWQRKEGKSPSGGLKKLEEQVTKEKQVEL